MRLGIKPRECADCPAYEWGVGFVPPTSPPEPEVALVGQGPGETEATFSRPFHENGRAGHRLQKMFTRAGFSRRELWVGNVVQCWLPQTRKPFPKGNRTPTPAEVAYCWKTHVKPGLYRYPSLVHVVPVGAPAAKFFLGRDKVGQYMGTTQRVDLEEL